MSTGKTPRRKNLLVGHPAWTERLSEEWDWEKNDEMGIKPDEVTAGSEKRAWWLGKCGHEWDMPIKSRTSQHQNCPYCSGRRVLTGFNSLSIISPQTAAEWHPTLNGTLTPDDVTVGSSRSVWWICSECGHIWLAAISDRTTQSKGCPKCAYKLRASKNSRPIVGITDLQSQHPEIAAEWHPSKNGQLTPQDVRRGSKTVVWWLGRCGHEWKQAVYARTSMNQGCPTCGSSKGEKNATLWAKSQGFVVDEQWRHSDCRDKNSLPFDLMLYVPVGNALMEVSAVEYDGVQHSDETTYFNQKNLARGGISYVQRHDAIKTNFCLVSHRVLIRVPHTVTGEDAIGEYISERLVENGLGWCLDDIDGDVA